MAEYGLSYNNSPFDGYIDVHVYNLEQSVSNYGDFSLNVGGDNFILESKYSPTTSSVILRFRSSGKITQTNNYTVSVEAYISGRWWPISPGYNQSSIIHIDMGPQAQHYTRLSIDRVYEANNMSVDVRFSTNGYGTVYLFSQTRASQGLGGEIGRAYIDPGNLDNYGNYSGRIRGRISYRDSNADVESFPFYPLGSVKLTNGAYGGGIESNSIICLNSYSFPTFDGVYETDFMTNWFSVFASNISENGINIRKAWIAAINMFHYITAASNWSQMNPNTLSRFQGYIPEPGHNLSAYMYNSLIDVVRDVCNSRQINLTTSYLPSYVARDDYIKKDFLSTFQYYLNESIDRLKRRNP